MSTLNYKKMTDGQKLADWMAELSTCVYKKLKKAKVTMGILRVFDESTGDYINIEKLDTYQDFTYLADDHTIEEVETYLNKNIKKTSGYEFHFNFDEDEIKDIFNGSVVIEYDENDNGQFRPYVFLGMVPGLKSEKPMKSQDEFIRDKTDQAKVFDLATFDIKKTKTADVGDLVVDKNNTMDEQRGVASKIVNMDAKGKLFLQDAFDDAGYTDCPIEVSRKIEDPVEFYSLVPQFLEKPWGIRGVLLDEVVHKKAIKKHKITLKADKDGIIWYPFAEPTQNNEKVAIIYKVPDKKYQLKDIIKSMGNLALVEGEPVSAYKDGLIIIRNRINDIKTIIPNYKNVVKEFDMLIDSTGKTASQISDEILDLRNKLEEQLI